jgi:hypothetical protein
MGSRIVQSWQWSRVKLGGDIRSTKKVHFATNKSAGFPALFKVLANMVTRNGRSVWQSALAAASAHPTDTRPTGTAASTTLVTHLLAAS